MKSLTGKICRFFDKIIHRAVGEAAPQPVEVRGEAHNTAPVRRKSRCLRVGLIGLWVMLGAWVGSNETLSGVQAKVNMTGKVTFKIGRVELTPAQAQAYMTNKTPVWLKVSVIMRDDWVTYIDNKSFLGLKNSTFAYAIVTGPGKYYSNDYDTDPKAYILSVSTANCSLDGISLKEGDYIYNTTNEQPGAWANATGYNACPVYEYLHSPEATTSITDNKLALVYKDYYRKGSGDAGDGGSGPYYEIDLYYIGFLLKPGTPQTIYVRGTDVDLHPDNKALQDPAAPNGASTTRATQMNFFGTGGFNFTYDGTSSDVTKAPPSMYGGCIPGGIFINTDAEVTQFAFDKPVFCPGEKVTFKAQVKVPNDMKRSDLTYHLQLSTQAANSDIYALKGDNSVARSTAGVTLKFDPSPGDNNANGLINLVGEMTWAAYQAYITGADKTTAPVPEFRFYIHKTADATIKVIGSQTAQTESRPLPKIRLHVSNTDNTTGVINQTESPYTRKIKGGSEPYDIVSGMDENATVHVRPTCATPSGSAGSDGSLILNFDCVASSGFDEEYIKGFSLWTIDETDLPSASAGAGSAASWADYPATILKEARYFATFTWNNGCAAQTDTIRIKPKKQLAAPMITIDPKLTCASNGVFGPEMPGGMEMKAFAPSNVTTEDWQWVIRQEACVLLPDNYMTNFVDPSTITDPLTPPSGDVAFGGGFIMSTSGAAYGDKTYPKSKSYTSNYGSDANFTMGKDYKVDYTLIANQNGTRESTLSLSGRAQSFVLGEWGEQNAVQYKNYTSGGALTAGWMPKPDNFLPQGSGSECADKLDGFYDGTTTATGTNDESQNIDVSPYYRGTAKNIYVRYKTNSDEWSPWGYVTTDRNFIGISSFCANSAQGGLSAPKKEAMFDLTARHILPANKVVKSPNIATWGANFAFSAGIDGRADTIVERGSAVALKVTTDLDAGVDQRIILKADLFWEVSTDNGSTWTMWHVTPAGTEIGEGPAHIIESDLIGFIEAPLRYPTQKELHKVIYMPTCPTTPSCDTSSLVTIGVFSTVVPGEIVADLGGGVYKDIEYKTLCADTVDLVLRDYQPGATLKWYYREPSESNWTLWSGMTSDKVTYKDFKALTNQTQYTNGTGMQFKVWVVAGTDSAETNPFTVTKHYVMTPTLKPVTAKLTTSGVCVGTKADLSATTAQSYAGGTYVLEQSTDGVTFGGSWGTTSGKNFSKAAVALSDNGLYLRAKNTNNGCVAYSKDTVIKVVNKPAAGTISPSEICPNRDETLTYSGPGDEFAWSRFKQGEVEVPISGTGRSVTINVPAGEFWTPSGTTGLGVSVSVTPSTKITVGADVTTCAGDFVDVILLKADNCSVKLTANPTAFCANDLKDVALTLTPTFPTSGNTFTFQYSTNNGSSWSDMTLNTDYTVTTSGANTTGATVKSTFFGNKSGAVQFRVKVSTLNDPSAAVTVTVNPLPTFANLSATAGEQCAGEDLQLKTTASASVSGGSISSTVYAWQVAADASANTAGTYNNVGASDASGAATYTGAATNTLTMKTAGTITPANCATLSGRYFKVKVTATTNNGCTDTKYTTPAVQVKLNPLPDTAKFVKAYAAGSISGSGNGKTVATTACKGTPVTLTATLDGTLKAGGTPKQSDYTYLWKEGSSTLANNTNGYAIISTGNTESKCVVPGTLSTSLADNTKKTFTLTVGATAQKTDGSAGGCLRSVVATYEVTYKTCAAEAVTIGGSSKAKGTYFDVCENDADGSFKPVSIAPASLTKADNQPATITKQTLYHCVKNADGTYGSITQAAQSTNATPPVLAATGSSGIKGHATYGTPGSHYYFAVVERSGSGFEPRVSDTIEYLIGAVPANTFSGVAVKAKSSNSGTTVTDFSTTLNVCAGLQVDLKVSGMPAEPTDITASTGIAKGGSGLSKGFVWKKSTTVSSIPADPAGDNTGGTADSYTLAAAVSAGSSGQTGYYHVWRTYQRNTLIKTPATATYKTCEKTFAIGTAQVKVVAMPTKPTVGLAASPSDKVCAGTTVTITPTVPNDGTPSNHTYKYRWLKTSGSTTTIDPAYVANKQPFESGSGALSAPGTKSSTPTANESWTLKAYLNNTEGGWSCYDTATGTLNITVTPLPTLASPTLADKSLCTGGANVELDATRPVASGVTYLYKWFKCDGSNTAADTASGKATAVTGGTSAKLSTNVAGKYFVRVTAYNSSGAACPVSVLSNVATVTVKPLPTFDKLEYTAGGTAGTKVSICAGGTPALTWAPKAGISETYAHKSIDQQGKGALSNGNKTFTIGAPSTATAGNQVYNWTLTATLDGCTKDSAIKFEVKVNDCSKDAVLNGRNDDVHSATVPFKVCANEPSASWPTVKIKANDWGAAVSAMKLYHSTASTDPTHASFTEVPAGAWLVVNVPTNSSTPNEGTIVFDPTHASAAAAYKTTGSHYYYAKVTRSGLGAANTDVVEYMVGKLPERSVVGGGHIATLTSATAPSSYSAGDSLKQFCVGEAANAYMYIVGAGAPSAPTSLVSSQWYETNSHAGLPDLPDAWTKKGTDNTASGAIALGTSTSVTKKFYYQYRKYRYSNAFAYATATADLTCDTTYPIGSVGIVIVNPKPTMPTAVAANNQTVCDGTSVTINGALTPAAAASGTEWRYRWLRASGCGTAGTTNVPFNSNTYPAANADWATKFGAGLAQGSYAQTVTANWSTSCAAGQNKVDHYKLVVYGKASYTDATYGSKVCYDSSSVLSGSVITIKPQITISTAAALTPANGQTCFDKTGANTIKVALTPTATGQDGVLYQWYKLRDEAGATPDTTKDYVVNPANMPLFSGAGNNNQVTVKAQSDSVNGKYYARVRAYSNGGACEVKVLSTPQEIKVNPLPKHTEFVNAQTINTVAATTYVACAGKEDIALQVGTTTTNNGATVAKFTYKWTAKPKGTGADNTNTWTIAKAAATKTANTTDETYTLKITGTSAAGCATDTTVNFTVKILDCSPDGIADNKAGASTRLPSAYASGTKSVAICKSEADGTVGKPLNIVPNPATPDERGKIKQIDWYYAPVKTTLATGNKLDVDWTSAKKAKTCTGTHIITTSDECIYNPAKDAATDGGAKLNTHGEWVIWIKVTRENGTPSYSDTISYVVRKNPEMSNLDDLKLGWDNSVPADKLLCGASSPSATLSLNKVPKFTAPASGESGQRGETAHAPSHDKIKYVWTYEVTNAAGSPINTDAAKTAVETYTTQVPKTTPASPVLTAGYPTGTKYQDNYKLTAEFTRTYTRVAGSGGLPTYALTCAVMDGSSAMVKTLRDTIYASIAPKGTLKDGDSKTTKSLCTSAIGASDKITLTFKEDATTPAATVTKWEWDQGNGTWADWAAANASTPKVIEVSLGDNRLAKPAEGAQKTYKFRAKMKNGACDDTSPEYALTIEGAVSAGNIAFEKDKLCAGVDAKLKATNVKPATAKIDFAVYTSNPGSTESTSATAAKTATNQSASGGNADWPISGIGTTADVASGAVTYHGRYVVKATSSICGNAVSPVTTITYYPTPALSFGAATPGTLCLTDDAEVEIVFTKLSSVDEVKVYTFNAALSPANKTTASAADAAHTKTLTSAEISAKKFKLDKAQLYANSSQGDGSKTYVYAVATQSSLASVSGADACKDAFAGAVEIKTGLPVTKPEIVWNSATSSDKDAGTVEEGTIKQIFKKTGGDNANTANSKYYWGVQAVGSSDIDYSKKSTQNGAYVSPYSFTANKQEYMHVWLEMPGYNSCPTVYSDTIIVKVVKSQKCVIKGVSPICRVGKKSTIEMEIDAATGAGPSAIRAGSQKWSYKLSSASTWTEINAANAPTAVVDASAPYKLTWSNHGLQGGKTYDFKVDYTVDETGNPDVTNNYTLTIYAEPTLSSLDALNLPGATCQDVAKDVTLKSGVTAFGTVKLMFKSQDTATATGWTEKGDPGTNTATFAAKNLADSGFYRAIVFTQEVCDTLTSYSRIMVVNRKPNAGTLTIAPQSVCFGQEATVTLSGYSGKIVDYEYHPSRIGVTTTGDKPASPADGDKVWRSITSGTSTTYPFPATTGLTATDGVYPATWKVNKATYGYYLRAKVTNGACAAEYAAVLGDIYDTVIIKKNPQNVQAIVETSTGLPKDDVTFTATGDWAGGKYADKSASGFSAQSGRTTQWQYAVGSVNGPWTDLANATGKISGATSETLTISKDWWATANIDKDKLPTTYFRMVVTGASCNDDEKSNPAKVEPQTDLKAGTIEPQADNTNKCFFYGDTVILFHNGASGQGRVSHHWRHVPDKVGESDASVDMNDISTLASKNIRAWHPTIDGVVDSSKIYMLAPAGTADVKAWWAANSTYIVVVTDSKNTTAAMFDADGTAKKNAATGHFAVKKLCFAEKPLWKMPNDTICSSKGDTLFVLNPTTLGNNTKGAAVNINLLEFALKAKSETAFTKVTTFNGTSNTLTGTYTVGSDKLNAELEVASGKPTGTLTLEANPASTAIAEAFDSLLVQTVVHTDHSQKNDTIYAVLRIDKGIKEIEATTDLVVCEHKELKFEAKIVRHQVSILRPIEWIWQRPAGTDVTDGRPTPDEKKPGDRAVKPSVTSVIAKALPTDSTTSAEKWTLKATAKCGTPATKDYNVKVNVIPTWIDNLSEAVDKKCAGDLIELTAKMSVNWNPSIVWEHSLTGADGTWSSVPNESLSGGGYRVETIVDSTSVAHQTEVKLRITPSVLTDSGYYRIKVGTVSGMACADTAVYSKKAHISLDTVPLFKVDGSSKKTIAGRTGLRTAESTSLTVTVINAPTDPYSNPCPKDASVSLQTGTWYVMKPNADATAWNTAQEWNNDYASIAVPSPNTADNGKTYKMDINSARGELNNLKFFMKVDNCCGTSYTDTVQLTVTDNLAITAQDNDTVCEGEKVELIVKANLNIDVASKRKWQYSKDGTSWTDVPLKDANHALFPNAEENMENNAAVLTIPKAPYALNRYKFRLGLTESNTVWSNVSLGDVMTLIVKPVNNLRVFVSADPNPAPNESTVGFNWTELTAKVAVVTPRPPTADTAWLSDEDLTLFGYTTFDWYQIRRTMNEFKADCDSFNDGDPGHDTHGSVFRLEGLKLAEHDSSLYYADLVSACVTKRSDTTLLRMYTDLHVEWQTGNWERWVDNFKQEGGTLPFDTIWLPEGTTAEELLNYPDLPPHTIIPLKPTDADVDGTHGHRMSKAFYIFCPDAGEEVFVNLELLQGVMSQKSSDLIVTREWQYSDDGGETWYVMDKNGENLVNDQSPIAPGTSRWNAKSQSEERDPAELGGYLFRFVAHAQLDVEKNPDGSPKLDADGNQIPIKLYDDEDGMPVYKYVYNDTSRWLEMVIADAVEGMEFQFKSDRDENEAVCADHDYVFAVTPSNPSYHYEWWMMRPGDTGFVKIDTLPDIDTLSDRDSVFHYGFVQDRAKENGTMVRVKIKNSCGDTIVEGTLRVMTVKLDPVENTDLCADAELELKATAKDYGEKEPTYKWFINGVEVPGQTTTTLKFGESMIPAAARNAEGKYEVQIVAYSDASVNFINRTACDKVTIMLRPLPTGINASANPAATTVEEGSTLSATVAEGHTVLWSPADKVESPTSATTPAKDLSPGENIFYATVTTEYGCTAKDSVIVTVASTFALDSMTPIAIMPPTLPFDDNRDENGNINPNDTIPQTGEYGAQRGGMVTADSMVIWACEKSVGFVTLHTSGGTPVLIYEWINPDGTPVDTLPGEGEVPAFHRLTAEEVHAYGYDSLVNDSTFAFYLDGRVNAFRCKITDKDGRGTTLVMRIGVLYYVTQHVALEAIPHMRHNRFYEDQSIFLSGHPTRFSFYSFYDYNVSRDEITKVQRSAKPVYATDYVEEEGEDRVVYVAVFDEHKCRSYDSVVIKVIPLPNAMILNDDGYPEGDLLFPEFEVEIHDSWGRMVKAMDQGRGWDGTRGGKQVQGGTYYYRVKLPTVDGHTFIKGAVTVFTKKK